jgi:hypothetical protein
VTPRPEIVLPPGFALRIDYDPESSPASLLITAYRDDAPVGQAHLDPREVGRRLRLEVESDGATSPAHCPRLRLTPQRAMRAIVMDAAQEPAPPRELPPVEPPEHPAMTALRVLALEGAFDECAGRVEERPWVRVHRAVRSFAVAAADLLGNPLRLRDADADGWPLWGASWRGAHQPIGGSEG